MLTEAELAAALTTTRVWLRPFRRLPGVALRGRVLHPEDAAADIMIAVTRARAGGEETPGG